MTPHQEEKYPGKFVESLRRDIAKEEIVENMKKMKAEINSYFDNLAKNAKELRKDNNSLNDAEIISGRYKREVLEIIEKYFPSPNER